MKSTTALANLGSRLRGNDVVQVIQEAKKIAARREAGRQSVVAIAGSAVTGPALRNLDVA
jgi:hypothetical protein